MRLPKGVFTLVVISKLLDVLPHKENIQVYMVTTM